MTDLVQENTYFVRYVIDNKLVYKVLCDGYLLPMYECSFGTLQRMDLGSLWLLHKCHICMNITWNNTLWREGYDIVFFLNCKNNHTEWGLSDKTFYWLENVIVTG